MADESAISWTDATFNPWIGCEKVSPACAHCYAETLAENRMGLRADYAVWGKDAPRRITADSTWRKPIRWAKLAREGLLPNGQENRDGHRPRVFCASMADVFEDRPDLETPRLRLFALIEQTPELDWLILTKRPEFARDWLREWYTRYWLRFVKDPEAFADREWTTRDDLGWAVLPNVWIGASIENSRFTWRADVLREIPASVRFISAEPLLGSLLDRGNGRPCEACHGSGGGSDAHLACGACDGTGTRYPRRDLDLEGIDWLIVGGESGGRTARPTNPEWVRELRDYAVPAGIAFHFKQWGSYAPRGFVSGNLDVDSRDEKEVGGWRCFYYGAASKAAGKIIDGAEWCEFPREAVPA